MALKLKKQKRGDEPRTPLPPGEVLTTDIIKDPATCFAERWVLGTCIGNGTFGELYLAIPDGPDASRDAVVAKHVVKVACTVASNFPLATELVIHRSVTRYIENWVREKGLRFLGIPKFIGSGSLVQDSMQYHFMVMERCGNDLQKTFEALGRRFSVKTVCYLALRLLEALEFLHEHSFVHADVKASNIVLGLENKHQIYLVDYGCAVRYLNVCTGLHKEDRVTNVLFEGTINYTSIDVHNGKSPSRRADLETLGYCLLEWASARLPWDSEDYLEEMVAQMKMKDNVDGLMTACFGSSPPTPSCLKDYLQCVYKLGYKERPDYEMLKGLFHHTLKSGGMSDDYSGLDWIDQYFNQTSVKTNVLEVPPRRSKRIQEKAAAFKQGIRDDPSAPERRKHKSGDQGATSVQKDNVPKRSPKCPKHIPAGIPHCFKVRRRVKFDNSGHEKPRRSKRIQEKQ